MAKIYTATISSGYVGIDQYYIVSEHDYMGSLCFADSITENFRCYGVFPSTDEIMMNHLDEEGKVISPIEAEDILEELICEGIGYETTLATLDDLNTLDILPESKLYEDCEEIQVYKKMLLRDETINIILK
jgi:hypothetical protein